MSVLSPNIKAFVDQRMALLCPRPFLPAHRTLCIEHGLLSEKDGFSAPGFANQCLPCPSLRPPL